MALTGGIVVDTTRVSLLDEMVPLLAVADHTIDGAPVGQSTQAAIIDKEVGLELTREMGVVFEGLLGIVAVHGIELHAALAAPAQGSIQEFALAAGPQDELMPVGNEHLEGLHGEGYLLPYLGISVVDDGSVEINRYRHINQNS